MARDQEQDEDEQMQAYLRSLDLQRLDLSTVELDLEEESNTPRDAGDFESATPWWRIGLFLITIAALLYLPTTTFAQLHDDTPLFWGLSITGLMLGLSLGSWVWNAGLRARERDMSLPNMPQPPALPRVPPGAVPWLLLGAAVILGAVLYFALPHDAMWAGNGYASEWFWGVFVAIAIGVLLGRWLIAQASLAPKMPRDTRPIKLPSWFKWANLAMLIGGAMFALFGDRLFSQQSDGVGFGMSGVGLAVGVLGAIWVVRRFDELEAKLVQRTRERQRGA